ncbi:hypothetical protein RAS1_38040 [Phycisphaerae bacterium RAS1]|nr:hypothetical protein RAS1_38040 [Phycisphaerae bacterium RAS1]
MVRALAIVRIACFVGLATWCGAPIIIEQFRCVYLEPCGAVSQSCWAPPHIWGSTTCTYCTGDQQQSLCERWENTSCNYTGVNQKCGRRMSGTCIPGTHPGVNVGTCMNGTDIGPGCTVPMC